MKTAICELCVYKISVLSVTPKCCHSYAKCTCCNKLIRYLNECPLGYTVEEYNDLLQKGQAYDKLRFMLESD